MDVAIIGTGSVGANLGLRLAEAGHDIVFGVRRDKDLTRLLSQCGGRARSAGVADAVAGGEVVFLAVPAGAGGLPSSSRWSS